MSTGTSLAHIPSISQADCLLVTGGARGITADCIRALARHSSTGFVLVGRTALPPQEPEWARGVSDEGLIRAAAAVLVQRGDKPTPMATRRLSNEVIAIREITGTLEDLRAAGAPAEYVAIDLSDAAATQQALAPYRGRITGLVHGAGVLADRLIVDKTQQDIEKVLGPKLFGLKNILDALDAESLRRVIFFASVAGTFGNRGQSDYAAANEALCKIAVALANEGRQATAIAWGAWKGGMVSEVLEKMFAERGIALVQRDDGPLYFVEQFSPAHVRDTVTIVGPNTPLSSADIPLDRATVRVDVAPLRSDPVLADHTIGEAPVIPLAAIMGEAARIAEAQLGNATVTTLHDVSVLSGVTLAEQLSHLVWHSEAGSESAALKVTDDSGKPRYALTALSSGAAHPTMQLPARWPATPVDFYGGAGWKLFHGPRLRGLTGLAEQGPGRVVLTAKLAAQELAGGFGQSTLISAALLDQLLQAALVAVHRTHGAHTLPLGVGRANLFAALPFGEEFYIEAVVESAAGPIFTVDVAAYTGSTDPAVELKRVRVVALAEGSDRA